MNIATHHWRRWQPSLPTVVPTPLFAGLMLLYSYRFYVLHEPWLCTAAVFCTAAAIWRVLRAQGASSFFPAICTAARVLAACGYAWATMQGQPSAIFAGKRALIHALVGLVTALIAKGYGAGSLPWPIRLLAAEICTLGQFITWHGNTKAGLTPVGYWSSFVLLHIAGVVLPLAIFPEEPQSQTKTGLDAPQSAPEDSCDAGPSCTQPAVPPVQAKAPLTEEQCVKEKRQWECEEAEGVYRSVLGQRITLNIKIKTRHHPEHLPCNALNKLARLVESFDMHDGGPLAHMTLGASVRRGCILISLDMCEGPAAGSPSTSSSGDGTSSNSIPATAAEALAYAKQVLPSLLAELSLDEAAGCSMAAGSCSAAVPPLQPGHYLQLQLGSHTVRASVDARTQEWVFELQPQADDKLHRMQLRLAQPDLLRPAAADPAEPGLHAVPFKVQLQGADALAGRELLGSDPSCMADDTAGSSPQLWVLCQGQYVRTVVHEIDLYLGTVRATAYVTAAALARHHQPDGPAARLQLLAVELGLGAATISRTQLLLDAAQHMQPAVQPSSFGWWGASAEQAAGLVADVCSLTAAAALDSSDMAVSSHQAFVSDVAVWLDAVQQAAPANCCDMCEPRSCPLTLTLTIEQHTALAASLQQHAAHSELTRARSFLQRTQEATGLGVSASSGAVLSALASPRWRLLRRQLTCNTCEECDAVFYTAVRQALGATPVYFGIARAAVCVVLMCEQTAATARAFVCLVFLACLQTAGTVWVSPDLLKRGLRPGSAAGSGASLLSHRHAAWLLLSFVQYAYMKLGVLLGLMRIKRSPFSYTIIPATPISLCFSAFGHHISLWGRMPTIVGRLVVLMDSCLAVRMLVWRFSDMPLWYALFLAVSSVGAPWVVWCVWRHTYSQRVRRGECTAHAQEIPDRGCGSSGPSSRRNSSRRSSSRSSISIGSSMSSSSRALDSASETSDAYMPVHASLAMSPLHMRATNLVHCTSGVRE